MSPDVSKALTGSHAVGLGGLTGGGAGAGVGLNQEFNNRQLFGAEKDKLNELAKEAAERSINGRGCAQACQYFVNKACAANNTDSCRAQQASNYWNMYWTNAYDRTAMAMVDEAERNQLNAYLENSYNLALNNQGRGDHYAGQEMLSIEEFTQIFNDYQATANAIYNYGSYGQTISDFKAQMVFDKVTGEYVPLPTGSAVDIAGTEENQQQLDFINGNKVQGQFFTTQSQEEFSNHNIGWIFKESADYSKAWEDYQRLYVLGQPEYYKPMGFADFYQKWNADHYYV